ncbi:MAG: transglutaminase domain-containing protein [Mesorhizobium sp.]|nr:transglutaminase-like domain-containing protein [Mesorhizobium sp.]MBL8579864.1 transglutaminase domain-containing protein [Mesorhizobium sp.]
MKRRNFLFGAAAAAASLQAPFPVFAQKVDLHTLVSGVEAEIARLRSTGKAISSKWVAGQLGETLTAQERRVAGFEVVQNVPYKLTSWTGDPDSLFNLGRGDCRHKANAMIRVLRAWKMEARPIQVLFDWASLPIPANILANLAETRGIHDSVEVMIDGKYVLIDPTWDPALAKVGFPVLAEWDGITPTLPIADDANVIIRQGDLKAGTNIYAYFGLKPERKRTIAFNRAFNAWTDEFRMAQNVARK